MLAALALMGCSGDSEPAAATTPPTGILLEKTQHVDVTPVVAGAVVKGHRPDVAALGNRLYLAYDALKSSAGPGQVDVSMLVLDADLGQVSFTQGLFKGAASDSMTTDIRTATDGSKIWYAIESGAPAQCECINHLSYAVYSPQDFQNAELIKEAIATGCPSSMLHMNGCSQTLIDSTFAVDDPTPFVLGSDRCIIIRKNAGLVLRALCFDAAGGATIDHTIEAGSSIPLMKQFSQNAVAVLDGTPWLFTGAETEPQMLGGLSSVYALRLTSDLAAIDGTVAEILPGTSDVFNTRVVAARQYDHYVVLTYVRVTDKGSARTGRIAAFDIKDGFKKVADAVAIDHGIADDHLPMEILGDRAYVFHQAEDTDSAIVAEVFKLRQAGSRLPRREEGS